MCSHILHITLQHDGHLHTDKVRDTVSSWASQEDFLFFFFFLVRMHTALIHNTNHCSSVISAARISSLSKLHIMNCTVRFMGSLTTPLLAHIGFICLLRLGLRLHSRGIIASVISLFVAMTANASIDHLENAASLSNMKS